MAHDLWSYVASVQNVPFEWGKHDCLTFANECERLQGGQGFADEWLCGYDSAMGAAKKYLRERRAHQFYTSIIDVANDRMCREMTLHPSPGMICARLSDTVGIGYTFGVVSASGSLLYVGEDGLESHDVTASDMFWSVAP